MSTRARWALALTLVAALVGAGGCGIVSEGGENVRLTVTRDFGAVDMVRATQSSSPGGETVMRLLQRHAKVETRYAGRFVNAIDGVRSSSAGGRRKDWFYYVNGIEADVGAADRDLKAHDRVWWDYHDWGTAMRVPAVVGSYPEPFIHGAEGKRFPVRIDCAANASDTCERVSDRLDEAGISPSTAALGAPAGKELLRFVVGKWSDIRSDGAVRQIEKGPAESGVFARLYSSGKRVDLMSSAGTVAKSLTLGAGLVAATRFEEQQPTWIVSGTDQAGLDRATELLTVKTLHDRFAVATDGSRAFALPMQ